MNSNFKIRIYYPYSKSHTSLDIQLKNSGNKYREKRHYERNIVNFNIFLCQSKTLTVYVESKLFWFSFEVFSYVGALGASALQVFSWIACDAIFTSYK